MHHPQIAPERLQASTLGIPADVPHLDYYRASEYHSIGPAIASGEYLTIGDVGIFDPATGSIDVAFNITIPRKHWSFPLYETFPLDFTRDVEHTLIPNEAHLIGKGDIAVLENESHLSANAHLPVFLTAYLSLQPSQIELDRCFSGEQSVTLNYSFDKRPSFGSGKSTIVIPMGPIVKSSLRPYVHEQWRSYVAAHWVGWYKWFERRRPVGLFGRHNLVVVHGHVKAASRVSVMLKGAGRLSVTINVPLLRSDYEQHIVKKYSHWLSGSLCSEQWTVENKAPGYKFERTRPWEQPDGIDLLGHVFGPGLWALPATSPAAISFNVGRYRSRHSHRDERNNVAVRAPRSNASEPAMCFDVADTLFYHTTSIGPKIPLLGFSGSRIHELPPLSSRSGWVVRARRKLKSILEARDEREKDDSVEDASWLLWEYVMKAACD